MNREDISRALNALDARHISDTAAFSPRAEQLPPERTIRMKPKRILSLALAAALILALGIAAYATDGFGLRALLIRGGGRAPAESPNGGFVSYTQPQAAPEGMDAAIAEKIDNSTRAWAEWDDWRKENGISQPEVFQAPEGTGYADYVENGDGSVTVIFYSPEPVYDAAGRVVNYKPVEIERRTATAEEYAREMAYAEAQSKGYGDYDYNYHVYTKEMADKLEGIAARYGLKLRHKRTTMFQNFENFTQYSKRGEITAKINEICAGGRSLFRTEPPGYEKFYYFDEGTFAVNFYTTEDMSNAGTCCYLYNSPYGTLSSGFEIFDEVKDVNAFSSRSHTTPDGTELTILQDGADMVAYVYLDNSFVTLHIMQPAGLDEAEIDAILDMVDFGAIT